MSGYTLSYRDKWVHPAFRDLREVGIWSWMSDTAAWKDTTVRIKEHTFNLKRGQLVTTIRFMSKGFSISDRATRTLLENLKKHGMIDTQTDTRATIVTICNYDKYQQLEKRGDTQGDEPPTNPRQTGDTNKNTLNTNNKNKEDKSALPDFIDLEIWEDFKSMRKSIKKPMSDRAVLGIVKKLSGFKAEGFDPNASLEQSIINCWQDVFPPKTAPKRERRPDAYQGM